jgi:flavin reductase (DIM6/NTAB) family NADH-FMN oxidoreductase RutF
MDGTARHPAEDLAEKVRRVHRQFPTGVTIVTTMDGNIPRGLAVNAFASISLNPPLVLMCVSATSRTYPRLFLQDMCAVNILAHDQHDLVKRFARSGGDKFAGVPWHLGRDGCPIIEGVSAYLELQVQSRLPAFTHTVFIGMVTNAAASSVPPLVYLDGRVFDSSVLLAARDERHEA